MKSETLRKIRATAAMVGFATLLGLPALAQNGGYYGSPQAAQYGQQPTAPQQLDDLVAPVALYPDALLSQVLVAASYPDQIAAAQQFLRQNPGLNGQALIEAAQQQPWDPSVQALVAFPDVIDRLNQNMGWTSALGQAFQANQADVMNAVQQMRQRAYQNGRLQSNAQQVVSTQYDAGSPVIEIQPASPEVVYVPVYDPVYVWGPPVYGYYPRLWYPGVSAGFYFGSGIHVGLFFGGGWGGWNNWGWRPSWGNRTVVVNNTFITRYGFQGGYRNGGFNGTREGFYRTTPVAPQFHTERQAPVEQFRQDRYATAQQFHGAPQQFRSEPQQFHSAPVQQFRGEPQHFERQQPEFHAPQRSFSGETHAFAANRGGGFSGGGRRR